ncbi:hypothetical protein FKM82_008746 [Ascaphus truei]
MRITQGCTVISTFCLCCFNLANAMKKGRLDVNGCCTTWGHGGVERYSLECFRTVRASMNSFNSVQQRGEGKLCKDLNDIVLKYNLGARCSLQH